MAVALQNLVIGSISLLVALYAKNYEDIDKANVFPSHPEDLTLPHVKAYDFIIVGAGSAGSTVANRLSREFSVLLLEAGGDPIPQTYVPVNFAFINTDPAVMHLWDSIKQTHSTLDDGGIAKLGQGKFLGGSSAVNGLSYNRGHPCDYDNWANLTGDDSWSYKNVLKYFQMTEDFHEEENLDGHLGRGGPLTIRKGGKELQPIYNAFLEGGRELGYEVYGNSNGPQTEGFGAISETLAFGKRVSAFDAFIKPILTRKTLTISKYSTVTKVDIDDSKRAIGVYYTQHGIQKYASAKLEVIISAGSMNSPQVLLRSGIGHADELDEAKIPVVQDLAVGFAFQDHPFTIVCGTYDDPTMDTLNNFTSDSVDEYLEHGSGPLTLPWGIFGQAFLASSLAKSEGHPEWPDIELIIKHTSPLYDPDTCAQPKVCLLAILGRVMSRGSVALNSSDISNPPIWDPRWLEHSRDIQVIAEGAKISAAILRTKAFKNIGINVVDEVNPSCKNEEFDSDAYWQCYARHSTRTTWHPTGTCKMGADTDDSAVVDTKLRVRGIKGLRVIDNSIQPTITNANTNAPAIMIGQKGSDMILKEYMRGMPVDSN